VNNAGISIPGSIEEYTEDDWERIMAVNMKGVFLGTKYALPAMCRAGGGSIINISSGAGIAPAPGTSAAYAATKGGVRLFTKATAVQYASNNIRCNSVHPGPIDTPMIRGPQRSDAWVHTLVERVPLGRLGTSEDIAYGVLYLASDESSFVTGSELVIDGGRTAQ
jgi:cyclopentanol dehydrogenase